MAKSSATFGQRLRAARLKAGYHKARLLAEDVGVTANTYYRYERDETTPPYKMMTKLAEVLNTPLSDLVDPEANSDLPEATENKKSRKLGASDSPRLIDVEKSRHHDGHARAYCSVLAWKLANELAQQLIENDAVDNDSRLRLTAELYFVLKTDPSSAMARFNDALKLDSGLWQLLFEFLSVYHSLLEKRLPRPQCGKIDSQE